MDRLVAAWNWIDRHWWPCVAGTIAAVIMILWVANMEWYSDANEPPYGCVWYDMNPSKGADYKLACVEGYPKD